MSRFVLLIKNSFLALFCNFNVKFLCNFYCESASVAETAAKPGQWNGTEPSLIFHQKKGREESSRKLKPHFWPCGFIIYVPHTPPQLGFGSTNLKASHTCTCKGWSVLYPFFEDDKSGVCGWSGARTDKVPFLPVMTAS